MRAEVRKLVAQTDIEERLTLVPASAKVRGLYFQNNVQMLKREGLDRKLKEIFPGRYSAVRWYSMGHFLEHLAVSGALHSGVDKVHTGMEAIGHNNAVAFTESLLGRMMLRFLSRDPVKLLRQATASRRQSCTYGRWELELPKPGLAMIHMHEEYMWMHSYLKGAGAGTFHAVGHDVEVEIGQPSRFEGITTLRWDPEQGGK